MSYGDDYDDANYETVDYENAVVVLAKKQSTGELSSPSKSVSPTHRMITDR